MLSGVFFFSAGPGGAVKVKDCGGALSLSTLLLRTPPHKVHRVLCRCLTTKVVVRDRVLHAAILISD